jgi:dipeptidyl aminopeptidase/acylaminoacyl peptidase
MSPIYAVQSMTLPVAHPGSRELLLGKNASPELERIHTPALNVTSNTPPCFLVHAEDDNVVPVDNSLQLRAALKAASVPVEAHLFTNGGHGFGLRNAIGKPAAIWPELFVAWARTQRLG